MQSVGFDIPTEPLRESLFVERPRSEVHYNSCGVFFRSGEAIAVDFHEEHANDETYTLVSVDKRVIADNPGHIGSGHFYDAGFLTIGMELAWSRERGFEQTCVPDPSRTALDGDQAVMEDDGFASVDPDRPAHFARVCRVLR